MKTSSYEIFAAVAELSSFQKTAERLNVTPSAVSHAISQLENRLGLALIIRNRSEMSLTQDAQALLPIVERLLNEERQVLNLADHLRGLRGGKITIGAFSSVCINWLPTIIRDFSQEYPDVEIAIVQASFAEIQRDVRLGKVDIGFTTLPVTDSLAVFPLIKDEIQCVTQEDFTPLNGHSISKQDLIDQHFILQKSDYDQDTKAALDYYNVHLNAINFSIDDQSIIALVEAGLGLGILPKLALKKLSGNVRVYPFEKSYYRELGLIINHSQLAVPAVAAMKKTILNNINTK